MAEDENSTGALPRKRGVKALLLPLALAAALGGGAFYAVYGGFVLIPALTGIPAPAASEKPFDITGQGGDLALDEGQLPAFVPLEPLIIALGPESRSRHLKVELQAETAPGREAELAAHKPRILDVLNTFLRAVDERDFTDPRAMSRLQAQMLRRVQMVTPEGSVRDLLVQQFVLN